VYGGVATFLIFEKCVKGEEPRKSGPGHMLIKQPSEEVAENLLED
jgi:hypothetical protein